MSENDEENCSEKSADNMIEVLYYFIMELDEVCLESDSIDEDYIYALTTSITAIQFHVERSCY